MSISNYTDLQTSVANWINRNDLGSVIVDFIKLGETRINRDLRVAQMEEEATGTTSTTITQSRMVGVRHLALTIGGREHYLPPKFATEKSQYGVSGQPQSYGLTDSVIELYPAPDGVYSYRLVYYRAVDIAADSTNWLLTSHPDVYLFSALQEAAVYLRDAEGVGIYEGRYGKAIADVKADSEKRRYGPAAAVNVNRRAIA